VLVAEGDDLRGLDSVDMCPSCGAATGVAELYELLPVDLKPPVLPVLGEPGVRLRPQRLGVGHPNRRALDHNILAAVPPVRTRAAGRHRHLRVGVEVAVLLLLRAGAERERAGVPDADQRYGVRAPVPPDGDDPVELRPGEETPDVTPRPYLESICPVVMPYRLCPGAQFIGPRTSLALCSSVCERRAHRHDRSAS